MNTTEKIRKLETLPWQALCDIAIKKGLDRKEIDNKEKTFIIKALLSYDFLSDDEIEQLVNDYVYGDRIAFTLWTFQTEVEENDLKIILSLENIEIEDLAISGYRKLKILSSQDFGNRIEVLYVYSKEYRYIDESGHNTGVWEQHRGCLWIGKDSTYLACISKHEKMTIYVTKFISEKMSNVVYQIKPPKLAIDKCTNSKTISRIVLQGKSGEKTIVSRAGGITIEQEEEIERIRSERIDTSGSVIAKITENIDATIKYNVKNGSIGIHKHLPAPVLFAWSENSIKIILQEIENLKGLPAAEIFKEVGQEIKWSSTSITEAEQLNWYLSQIIASLDNQSHDLQIPNDKLSILENSKFFMKLPRVYCSICDSYEIPYCSDCGKELKFNNGRIKECDCGSPLMIKCSEGHRDCKIINWYLPTNQLVSMIAKNVRKIYKDYSLNYNMCIVGDWLNINWDETLQSNVEIPFEMIECFSHDPHDFSERIQAYAVNLNEKCSNGTCSYKKIGECLQSQEMVCLPKIFYSVLPQYRPQPHKGTEYGDVAAEVMVGKKAYELKGIIKKNSKNYARKIVEDNEKIRSPLLSTSPEGQEIIRQFVEQGMSDARCQIIAVIIPQYIDASFKGTLKYLARLSGKKVTFIELDEICDLIAMNKNIQVS